MENMTFEKLVKYCQEKLDEYKGKIEAVTTVAAE